MKYFSQIKKEGTRDKLSVSVSTCVFFLADHADDADEITQIIFLLNRLHLRYLRELLLPQ
jgi:hypothetical protein